MRQVFHIQGFEYPKQPAVLRATINRKAGSDSHLPRFFSVSMTMIFAVKSLNASIGAELVSVQDVAPFELRFGVLSSHARLRENGKRGFYMRNIGFGFILILGLLLTTYATGSGVGKPLKVSNGGIEGKVVKGPMCPVERIDQPCPDKPLEADIEIQGPDDQDNKLRIRSDRDGRFRIDLAPGKYTLTPISPNPGAPPRAPGPQAVTVESGKYIQVTIKYDSGIR